jgi:signal transduction histidine kinase/DNA-binding response OmpR family regulator
MTTKESKTNQITKTESKLEKELKTRLRQQAAVSELGQRALVEANLANLMDEAISLVAQTLEVEYTKILKLVPDGNSLLLKAGHGWKEGLVGRARVSVNSDVPAEYASLTRGPVIIEDLNRDNRFKEASLLHDHQVVSGLSVSIHSHNQPFGVLGAYTTRRQTFTKDDLHFLQAIAYVLATAIERQEAESQIVQRSRELLTLQSAGAVIMSSLDFQHVLNTVTVEMVNLLEVDSCAISDWNQADDTVSTLARYGLDSRQAEEIGVEAFHLAQFPLKKQVLTEQQVMHMTISQPDTDPAEFAFLQENEVKTQLMLPMVFQGRTIGLVEIIDCRVERNFTDRQIELAKLLTNQAAIAIDHARLYGEIHQYLEELTTLNMISQTITRTLDLQEMLTIIARHAVRLAGVEAASVVLYDEANNDLWFAAASGEREDAIRDMRLEMGQGIVGWVIQHEEAVLVPEVSADPRFFSQFDRESGFTTRSILCVPLQTKGHTIGAIEAINKERSSFDQDDRRLLTSLAAPAATAIETARLFELAQQEIAERKRAEVALEEERALLARRVAERTADLNAANRELARAARLKDEFVASMSHELRTPLTVILGLSEVLKTEVYGPLTAKQAESIHDIEESGHHLLLLINDVLDLSKIEAGQFELQIGLVSVETVCQSSLQFIKQAAHKKQLKISLTLDSAASTLQADERRLKQILVNLLNNAVKFTPENGTVGLEVAGDFAERVVHFTVWDTGIGISPEDMERLFQSFVQVDSSLARQHSGTGLGLVLVRRMVELHDGTVSVESEVGQGSRFTISLPWSEPMQLAGPVSVAGLDAPGAILIRRALIIDDSPTAADKLTRYLRQLGVISVIHPHGEGAVDKALQVNPDVIILDILLSDSSGWDVLTQLKAEKRTQNIPVLIASAVDERRRGLALGAAEYLVKPILQRQLQQALNQIVLSEAEPFEQDSLGEESDQDEGSSQVQRPLILVAEDDNKIATLLVDYLLTRKYQVIIAQNGIEALKQAKEKKPDIIIMDIQMPEMDGLEAIRRLRADTELAIMPIIALTALAMPGDKPINLEQLAKIIEDQLEQNSPAGSI